MLRGVDIDEVAKVVVHINGSIKLYNHCRPFEDNVAVLGVDFEVGIVFPVKELVAPVCR